MATNLALDDKLLDEAVKVGGKATKKATVTEALQEYIARRRQARVVDLFGTIDYDPKYDESARTLAFAAKASERNATGSGNVLTLTIGKDWTGTQTVVIKSSGSGSPSSGVTAKPADENVCVS